MKIISRTAFVFGVFLFLNVIQVFGQINRIYNSRESSVNILCFTVSQSLQKIFYTDNSHVYIYDIEADKFVQRFELESPIMTNSIAVSADGSILYLGSKEGNLLAYSVASEKLLWQMNLSSEGINCLALTCDEMQMYAGGKNGIVYQVELSINPKVKEIFQQKFEITDIKINCNQQILFASTSNGHLFSIDSKTNTLLADNLCSDNWIRQIELSLEKPIVYTVGDDGCFRTFKLRQQGVLIEINKKKISSNWLTSIATADKDKVIAYGGVGQKIYCSTPNLSYQYNFKAPVIASKLYVCNNNQISIIVSVYQNGLFLLPLKDMEVTQK